MPQLNQNSSPDPNDEGATASGTQTGRTWTHELTLRVSYAETDGQRRVHHSNYLNYFEKGRVEMLRSAGIRYKDLEDAGIFLVVSEFNIKYLAAAEFDDVLTLKTETVKVGKVRIRHRYLITRDKAEIVSAESVIACVNAEGSPCRLPKEIQQWRS